MARDAILGTANYLDRIAKMILKHTLKSKKKKNKMMITVIFDLGDIIWTNFHNFSQ